MPEQGPDFLKPCLRLFLSVDIVGSTAFKQGRSAAQKSEYSSEASAIPAEPWFSPIVQFYREIEKVFSKEWQHYCQSADAKRWPPGPAPEFWKGAGDEMIYTKTLQDHKQAFICLGAWMKGLSEYRGAFRQKFPGLDLKSSAWIAGFPVSNAEVILRTSVGEKTEEIDDGDPTLTNMELLEQYSKNPNNPNLIRDFIGPSIDTGFRLSTLATPRKLVVSVDLALLLVHALRVRPSDFSYPKLEFHFEGRSALKGVFGNNRYPVFWVDMHTQDELNQVEDKLSDKQSSGSDEVMDFCELFIRQNPNFVIRPYIGNGEDAFFRDIPDYHQNRITKLKAYWDNERTKRKGEEDSLKPVTEVVNQEAAAKEAEQAEKFAEEIARSVPGAPAAKVVSDEGSPKV